MGQISGDNDILNSSLRFPLTFFVFPTPLWKKEGQEIKILSGEVIFIFKKKFEDQQLNSGGVKPLVQNWRT